eukprot:5842644-Ditylum_brightwellii.AAC.1
MYKNCTNTTPAISSLPPTLTADAPSHPTPTNTEEEPPKETEVDSSSLTSGGDKSPKQRHAYRDYPHDRVMTGSPLLSSMEEAYQ